MASFDQNTLTRLLGSIEANNLVVICGAGLSIPAPSNLMSAARVAEHCYEKWTPTEQLPAALKNRIDELAGHFYDQQQFEAVFINRLVPWNDLVGDPNAGHAAIADLLISRAAFSALSANFDTLIERWAESRKIALRGSLNGVEAATPSDDYNPLLKFHGCYTRRAETFWTKKQLQDHNVASRITSCTQWMTLNLPAKHLLIVGFWTDWDYLNDVIEQITATNGISAITVVDTLSIQELQAKAPVLWAALTATGQSFEHVQASGDVALDELRLEFSKVWAKKFFRLGKTAIEAEGHAYPDAIENTPWTCAEIYELRLDGEGTPYNRAARTKQPEANAKAAALTHILLSRANATRKRAWYEHNGQTIRIVQGAGQPLPSVREKYNEAPAEQQPDIVVCAGAHELNVPGRIVATGNTNSVVRPAPGGSAKWLTFEQARAELAI